MNYIYYQTKTKFINTGDALINKALLDTLREYGLLRCNCSLDIPAFFIDELGIKESEKISSSSELGFVLDILKQAKKCKKNGDKVYIVSGLGHNFGGSLKKCIRNLITGILFPIYHIYGVKTIRIGMSIGPITKMLGVTENIRGKFIDYYYVRDSKSLELCKEIGIKHAKLCPDMSWIYDKNGKREFNKNGDICVNLRASILDYENDEQYRSIMLKKCEDLILKINKDKSKKLIFCYQVEEDKEFCIRCYNFFKNDYDCIFVENQLRLNDAESVYSNVKYNISNRMHSLLFGYKFGALPVALIDSNKHTKISQTFIDNNLDKLIIDIYNESDDDIHYLVENSDSLCSKLFNVEKNKQEEICHILDSIIK